MVKKLFVLALLIPTTAIAEFRVVEDVPEKPVPSLSSPSAAKAPPPTGVGGLQLVTLTYIGEPDADIPVITGFGRDLKLSEALKQVVPDGWHAFLKEDMATRAGAPGVNWKGGRRWVEVLDVLANDQNLVIDVDWTKKHLYVGERKALAVLQRPPTWVAKAGATLKESVSAWGEKAGWQIVWRAEFDYPILAQLTFDGAFIDAVTGIFRSYEKAERPLLADVHEAQKLIVISPRNSR